MAHYFIAIPIPEALQDYYSDWQRELETKLPYQRWMHPKDFHITLKFLGEADESVIQQLIEKISLLSLPKSFIIELGSIGFFGLNDRPRVLWVDVKRSKKLMQLQAAIEEALVTMKFEKEKRAYRPHMTLAKKWVKDSAVLQGSIDALREQFSKSQDFSVRSITLFRIHPKQEPSYEEVAMFPL